MFLVCIPLSVTAADVATASSVQLKVKPVLCIIDRRTPSCDMDFLIAWQSPVLGYYCLHNPFVAVPLRCWSEADAGQHEERRIVEKGFMFWMTAEGSDEPVAAVEVEVMTSDTPDRRRKRRTRHVWDIL